MKRLLIGTCLILSLLATGIVYAAHWVLLAKDESVELYINTESIKTVSSEDGIYSVWVTVIGKKETNGLHLLINMDQKVAAVADGVVINNKTKKEKPVKHTTLQWSNIEPNLVNGIVYSYLTENGYR